MGYNPALVRWRLFGLSHVFDGIRVERLDAGLAAELDLLAVVNLGNRLAYAAEAIVGTPGSDGLSTVCLGS